MALQQITQPAQLIALEVLGVQLQTQALGQVGARIFHAHHPLDPQLQATGEVVIADLAFDHHHRVGLQQ
ncbi:hypothetical protein D3C84_1090850 [compost metagenome]